jgi:hypothetical protein
MQWREKYRLNRLLCGNFNDADRVCFRKTLLVDGRANHSNAPRLADELSLRQEVFSVEHFNTFLVPESDTWRKRKKLELTLDHRFKALDPRKPMGTLSSNDWSYSKGFRPQTSSMPLPHSHICGLNVACEPRRVEQWTSLAIARQLGLDRSQE